MSVFDPQFQSRDLESKILTALERISESFRVVFWRAGKDTGLSPIQIQILLFIRYHTPDLCRISQLAKEFNMTKATVSDAVMALVAKKLVHKKQQAHDLRSQVIELTPEGMSLSDQLETCTQPLYDMLSTFSPVQKEAMFALLHQYLNRLTETGTIHAMRNCPTCRFLSNENHHFYCKKLQIHLPPQEMRLDCPQHQHQPQL